MSFLRSVEKLIFPDRCLLCGGITLERIPFCKTCIKDFTSLLASECPKCGKPPHDCRCTSGKSAFLFFYSDANAKKIILSMKHSLCKSAAVFFGGVIANYYEKRAFDAVVFPPRTQKNKKKYGFDHVKAIAEAYSRISGVKVIYALSRARRAEEQKLLSATQRRKNALGLYKADAEKLKDISRVLLIDDVRTTGSTLNACAFALRKAGVKQITQFTLASTPPAGKRYKIKSSKKIRVRA